MSWKYGKKTHGPTSRLIQKDHPPTKQQVNYKESEGVLWDILYNNKEENAELREYFIVKYMPFASQFGVRYYRRYIPINSLCSDDDVISATYVGLIKAVDSYNPIVNDNFKAWLTLKIKGAILDELRKLQNFPRSTVQAKRIIRAMTFELQQKLHKKITQDDLADCYGDKVPNDPLAYVNVYHTLNTSIEDESHYRVEISCEDNGQDLSDQHGYELHLESKIFKILSGRKLSIIYQYYFLGFTLADISFSLGISVSLTSCLKDEAIKILKEKLGDELRKYRNN